jgi:hypothetical protein
MTTAGVFSEEQLRKRLLASIATVKRRLREQIDGGGGSADAGGDEQGTDRLSPVGVVADVFGLSAFERDLLLLCAAVELDSEVPGLCASAHGDPTRPYVTFGLALASLPDPHWSALLPAGPLRGWRLLSVGDEPSLVTSLVRIDEWALHALVGLDNLDERLACIAVRAATPGGLVPSHAEVSEAILRTWLVSASSVGTALVVTGPDAMARRAVAASASAQAGAELWVMSAALLPSALADLADLARLWEREARLFRRALLLEFDETDPALEASARRFCDRYGGLLYLSGRDHPLPRTGYPSFSVGWPALAERRHAWADLLGDDAGRLAPAIDGLASQFSIGPAAIGCAVNRARGFAAGLTAQTLTEACLEQARPRLEGMAARITPRAHWDDLVLPDSQLVTLRQVVVQARRRAQIEEDWGFGGAAWQGVSVAALFDGDSGTGKTLTAEVIACELGLDLYRVDLSRVVSKYIGETEKNLSRVFDAPDEGSAVLLFDEADAIFGRRSEVKDSLDRYANIEVSYLLQRMESYRGVAILTTNLMSAIDTAFLRRLRFIVHFPFPDATLRAEIWKRAFPERTPTAGLRIERLSQLSVTGGSIHNIALHAAFIAADEARPVTMPDVLDGARIEYDKLRRSLTSAELAGWR